MKSSMEISAFLLSVGGKMINTKRNILMHNTDGINFISVVKRNVIDVECENISI